MAGVSAIQKKQGIDLITSIVIRYDKKCSLQNNILRTQPIWVVF